MPLFVQCSLVAAFGVIVIVLVRNLSRALRRLSALAWAAADAIDAAVRAAAESYRSFQPRSRPERTIEIA